MMATSAHTIAIVDDNADMRGMMRDLLSRLGFRCDLYGSGSEFLAAAPTSEADCLLVDIQLGDITGIELASLLQIKFSITEL